MSLPHLPICREQLEALPPAIQALIVAIIDHYEQRLVGLTAELAALKKTPRNSSLPPSTEHPTPSCRVTRRNPRRNAADNAATESTSGR